MTGKHTPGPWFIWQELAMQREGCGQDEITDELTYESEFEVFAGNPIECTRGSIRGHTASICTIDADANDFDDDDETVKATVLANARLIAAAPDLLEALTYAIKQVPELATVPGIAAAIAKAEWGAA